MKKLLDALVRNQDEIRAALNEAQIEVKELEQRRAELQGLISRALVALGEDDHKEEPHDLTLHGALEVVLSDFGDEWMSVGDLVAEVNRRDLYRMKDGRPVKASQIHARVNNYSHTFEKSGSKVRLRYQYSTSLQENRGAYWAARTVVRRTNDGAFMSVEIRLAYSVRPPNDQSPKDYVLARSEDRARKLISGGAFEPNGTDVALLTSTGWQPDPKSVGSRD